MNDARLRELIKRHEGLRLQPYRDSVGVLTIGYGHNLEGFQGPVPDEITAEEAEALLTKDIDRAVKECGLFVRGYDLLDDVRRAVLVDMCFNLGLAGLLTFRNTLPMIAAGNYQEAADNMLLSKWAEQVKYRAFEDAEMMRTGQWPAWLFELVPDQPEPRPELASVRKPTMGDQVLALVHWFSRLFIPRA